MTNPSSHEHFGVRLPAGTIVFRQGDPGQSVYIVRSGEVRVVKAANGKYRVVATLGPGEVFGEMAVLTGRPRSATVQVTSDAELLRVPAQRLEGMLSGAGELPIRLLKRLAERLDQANRLIDVLVEEDPNVRVMLQLLEEDADDVPLDAPAETTAEQMALQLGMKKNEARAALRRLVRVGVVEESNGGVVIKDSARLSDFLTFVRSKETH
jgi:CRP/FNR family cyclic AMP-dependent transcriptional regulator